PQKAPPTPAKAPPTAPSPPPPVAAAPAEPMPVLPPPPSASAGPTTLVEAPRAEPSETPHAEASHGSRWWLWTTLAVVAVGGGFAAYWFTRPKAEPLPPTTLGNYRF
ncbi:MAG TPA: hypothetical protein VHL80_11625, partial [Polyangia bacterium]|nr:hypothetical protein [Polyangia bacterium]